MKNDFDIEKLPLSIPKTFKPHCLHTFLNDVLSTGQRHKCFLNFSIGAAYCNQNFLSWQIGFQFRFKRLLHFSSLNFGLHFCEIKNRLLPLQKRQ